MGSAFALVATAAVVLLFISRQGLDDRVQQLENRVSELQGAVKERTAELRAAQAEQESLAERFDICQRAAQLSRRTFNLIDRVAQAAFLEQRAELQRLYRTLFEVGDQTDRLLLECMSA